MADRQNFERDKQQPAQAPSRESSSKIGYSERPDFYSGPKRGFSKSVLFLGLALSCGVVAALSTGWAPTSRTPASLAMVNKTPQLELVSITQQEEKLRKAVLAGEEVKELAHLKPVQRAAFASGVVRMSFIRVLTPGHKGDKVEISVNGSSIGVLDMTDQDTLLAYAYEPGQPLQIKDTVVGKSGDFRIYGFIPPDRKLLTGEDEIGNHLDWTGVAK